MPLLLRFSEAGLEHRWKKKGMKFYTLKYSVKIYIISLVTWCLYNTLHGRISKPVEPHNCIICKFSKAIICEKINQTAWKVKLNKQKKGALLCLFVCFVCKISCQIDFTQFRKHQRLSSFSYFLAPAQLGHRQLRKNTTFSLVCLTNAS